LPECAYRPRYEWSAPEGVESQESTPRVRKGVEEFLAENKIEYFVVDAHLLKGGKALGVYAERFGALRAIHETAMENYQPEDEARTPHDAYLVASQAEGAPVAV